MLTPDFAGPMLAGMVSDTLVYRAADWLITRYGAKALREANRLICDAVRENDADRAHFWCGSGWPSWSCKARRLDRCIDAGVRRIKWVGQQ